MIRNIGSNDIDKIMNIWLRSTIKAHDFIQKEYWENNYNIVMNMYIPMSETFVYKDEECIKGFISIINNKCIDTLFVDIDYKNRRIGKKLINYATNKYKNLNLAVYKENKTAVDFYINRGFTIIKEQANEDSGHNEYIMQ